jgi:quercetin dioxygenase-like cupin family protein
MTTFIETGKCARRAVRGAGEVAEIVNRELCGAENEVVMLRWLKGGDRLEAQPLKDTHQLIYLMEGKGVITLNGKDYDVNRGAGIYLGPSEAASVRPAAANAALKLLHLVVPHIEDKPGALA